MPATAYCIDRYTTTLLGIVEVNSSLPWFHITQIISFNTFCLITRTFERLVKEIE